MTRFQFHAEYLIINWNKTSSNIHTDYAVRIAIRRQKSTTIFIFFLYIYQTWNFKKPIFNYSTMQLSSPNSHKICTYAKKKLWGHPFSREFRQRIDLLNWKFEYLNNCTLIEELNSSFKFYTTTPFYTDRKKIVFDHFVLIWYLLLQLQQLPQQQWQQHQQQQLRQQHQRVILYRKWHIRTPLVFDFFDDDLTKISVNFKLTRSQLAGEKWL